MSPVGTNSDPFTARLIELLPELGLGSIRSTGRKHASERQEALAGFIRDAIEGRRTHHIVPGAIALPWTQRSHDLRTKDADTVSRLIGPFFEVASERHGNGIARAYRLRPHVCDAAVLAVTATATAPAVEANDRPDPTEHDRRRGMPAYVASDVPPVLHEIDLRTVDSAIARLDEDDINYSTDKALLGDVRRVVRLHGGLPNAFGLQPSGRLNPKDARIHLVNMPAHLRELLLGPLGWFDVDIKACHPAIWIALGQAWGFPTKLLSHYVAHRGDVHERWQAATGQEDAKAFKRLVTSMLYGSQLSRSRYRTVGQLLDTDTAATWIALPDVRALYREIQYGLRFIEHLERNRSAFVGNGTSVHNIVGRSIPMSRKRSQVVSHILTGYEQWAMNVAVSELPEGALKTVIYDGFIIDCPDLRTPGCGWEVRYLTSEIRSRSIRELGFPLELEFAATPFGGPDDF